MTIAKAQLAPTVLLSIAHTAKGIAVTTLGTWSQPDQVPSVLPAAPSTTEAFVILAPQTSAWSMLPIGNTFRNRPVGWYHYHHPKEIPQLLERLRTPPPALNGSMTTLAMWDDFYLKWGERVHRAAQKGYAKAAVPPRFLPANLTSREALVQQLVDVPSRLLLYMGHGRSRGWSAYLGLRLHHLLPSKTPPIGSVIAMTCDNLKFERGLSPFGVQWVEIGHCYAYLGAVDALQVAPMEVICSYLEMLILEQAATTIGELMTLIHQKVQALDDEAVTTCWQQLRLAGHPFTPL